MARPTTAKEGGAGDQAEDAGHASLERVGGPRLDGLAPDGGRLERRDRFGEGIRDDGGVGVWDEREPPGVCGGDGAGPDVRVELEAGQVDDGCRLRRVERGDHVELALDRQIPRVREALGQGDGAVGRRRGERGQSRGCERRQRSVGHRPALVGPIVR
jgi:hypothetical protein